MAQTKRRARGEDSIYYDRSRSRWTGTITVGWKPDGRRDRITVRGRTKTEVKDKLRAKHLELAAGVRAPAHYAVERCLMDWLETLNTQAATTVTGYQIMARHLIELIGTVKLVELKVRDVDFALGKLANNLARRHGLTHRHDVWGLQAAARRPSQESGRLSASATGRSRRTWRDRALPIEEHPPRGSESPPGRHGGRSESVRLNCPALFSRTARFALWS